MKVGYARVSSIGQNLDSQISALEKAGCEKIFQEKKSGSKIKNRPVLKEALDFVRDGDIFIVTRLDRCSRSVADLHNIMNQLENKNVSFKATNQEFDTSTSTGRLMVGLLSVVAAFELDLRAERQADGIAVAKKKGVRFGREPKMNEEDVLKALKLKDEGLSNQVIADRFEVGKSTLLRYFANYRNSSIQYQE